jgi:hypothetical protein
MKGLGAELVRDTDIFAGEGGAEIFLVLKIPRKCPHVKRWEVKKIKL